MSTMIDHIIILIFYKKVLITSRIRIMLLDSQIRFMIEQTVDDMYGIPSVHIDNNVILTKSNATRLRESPSRRYPII